jgi:diguanylate cyclase (GGDEF)-like protein/PAS domain S-box-containing protein
MQNILLDILIIGLLVLLFGSIYRKHATVRVRFWLLGWFFILIHFGALLLTIRPDAPWASPMAAAAENALLLCGAAFALSSGLVREKGWKFTTTALLLSAPPVAYVTVTAQQTPPLWALWTLGGVVQLGYGVVVYRFGRGRRATGDEARAGVGRRRGAVILLAGTAWLGYYLGHRNVDESVYPLLSEIFFLNALLYWEDFRRISAGVLVTVIGLAAWGAVFPSAMLMAAFVPQVTVLGELWNVPKYFVAFGMILTLLEEQKRQADRKSQEYRVLFESNPHPMWIFDTETLRFLAVNDSAVATYGYTPAEFRSMTLRDIRPPEEVEAMEQTIASARESVLITGPWTHILKDGRRIQVEVSAHTIWFEGRQARFSLVQDVTERQQLHHRLVHQAHHDMLTGLPNRLLLVDRMEQALASAARRGKKAAVMCLDLDRFKQINDTYGHAVGDTCLRQVADRLKSRLRAEDTVARSGGEEFTVVVGDLVAAEDATRVVGDLLTVLRKPLIADNYPVDVSASIGVAMYPDHGTDATTLWRNADTAMYRVKRSGGNDYVLVSQEISQFTSEANDLEMFMRRALKDGGLELHYQPEYGADGTFRGLEALLRLQHPKLGRVSPERFIPIAEESGLIVPIGNWVLREVCRQNEVWRRQGIELPRIAINVSPLQFMRMDFSRQVRHVLAEAGVAPHRLEIEMTETTVMRNLEDVARQMRDLAELGVHFSVDDFGTGYSSLQHLQELPIERLKIDRTFVNRVCEMDGTSALVRAILALAHSLNLQVVAEGVEQVEQAEALVRMKCDMMQGYLFSPPLRAEEIPRLIRMEPSPGAWRAMAAIAPAQGV